MWALVNPKIGERMVLAAMREVDADLVANRQSVPLIESADLHRGCRPRASLTSTLVKVPVSSAVAPTHRRANP